MIYLHKFLPLVFSPLGLVVVLIIIGTCLRRWWIIHLSWFVLLISSLPITSQIIWQDLEKQYPPKSLNNLGSYDAVVVLSGMLSEFEYDDVFSVDWGDPDRFFAGIDILKSEKVQYLIFTRGKVPWSVIPPEGEILRAKAIELGINESRILLSDVAVNTAEEAEVVAQLMSAHNIERVLLVTSSFHMPRAKFLFDNQKIDSVPFAVDYRATGKKLTWLSFLPNAVDFGNTSSGIREYIGRFYYRVKFS